MQRWNIAHVLGALIWFASLGVIRAPAQGVSFSTTPTVVSSGVSVSSGAGTSNITITSVNLPASQLQLGAVTGVGSHASSWRIAIMGHAANNANAKSVVVRVAGVSLDSLPLTASAGVEWLITCQIYFRSAGPGVGAQPYWCTAVQGPAAPNTILLNNPGSLAAVNFDPTVSQPLAVIAAVQTAAADIVLDAYSVELVQ